ncbi:TetR/AcrR family transcriptional regulator [Amnibacterium kyonggiense]|uniref:TetR family transcriptional regulator n=1 Tax=Amnibacterium kyonggiense TaxID=595671 RepID=A0A4R7FH81_9MICO|nr:TetR/AcrR family transcriptional regulator [Amnibacterium kyonggiense]TDS76097.1 TetR family transcriptional regulator [Amnibacterium kyonggiense]
METVPRSRRRPALERVVKTADRLFYANGIHATGVDTIADEADVSKASMYTYFRTKDDLVGAYVEGRSVAWREHLTAELEAADLGPAAEVLLVFDLLGAWFTTDDFNGCPFINAEAESTRDSPAHLVNVEHRRWIRDLFADRCARAGVADPIATSIRLSMLYDGAMVGAHTDPGIAWAVEARAAAAALLH